jgi:hypothetical protein
MPADQPFAVIQASASGLSLAITPGPLAGPSGTATLTSKYAPNLYVANIGPGAAYVRLTVETSTAAATQNDVCIPANVVRLFSNPAPLGTVQVAVIATVTTAAQVFVTPGVDGVE